MGTGTIILVCSVIVYGVGCLLDALSSVRFDGVHVKEKTRLFRRGDGKFNLPRYVLVMAGLGVALVVLAPLTHWAAVSGVLVFGGTYRAVVAARNRELTKKYGL